MKKKLFRHKKLCSPLAKWISETVSQLEKTSRQVRFLPQPLNLTKPGKIYLCYFFRVLVLINYADDVDIVWIAELSP